MSRPRLFSRASWRLQSTPAKGDLIMATGLWIGMVVVLMVGDSVVAALLWIVLGCLELATRYSGNVRYGWWLSQPEVPSAVEVTAHCGCVHRWAWDADCGLWLGGRVIQSSDSCLVEAR